MGESVCAYLMHSFSHHTRIINEPTNQGNHVHAHALGESISFGRFTSESLGCENWSNVPHKRYVEEAKSYAQPGSVAKKKAFFEAHYKKIAAQKAAAAAALLEQEKVAAAASQANEGVSDAIQIALDSETTKLSSHDSLKTVIKSHNSDETTIKNPESSNSNDNLENNVSVSDDSRTSQTKSNLNTEQEFTQPIIKKKPVIASSVSSIGKKPSRIPLSPAKYGASGHHSRENIVTPQTTKPATNDNVDKRRSAPKYLERLMKSSSVREPCKLNSLDVQKTQISKPSPNVRTTPKRGATPMKTPTKGFINGASKQRLATPSSENSRMETPAHPSISGSKSVGQKQHILSAVSKSVSTYRNKLQSPTILSPFILRTEDRAARRKQKLEEKFNEKETQMQQQTKLKEKAEMEFRRLRQTFCFKARPLPNFYKGRQTPENQLKKTPEANPKSLTPRRKPSSSMSSIKNKSSRRLWKSNDHNPTQHPLSSIAGMMSHENVPPNIEYSSINTHKAMR